MLFLKPEAQLPAKEKRSRQGQNQADHQLYAQERKTVPVEGIEQRGDRPEQMLRRSRERRACAAEIIPVEQGVARRDDKGRAGRRRQGQGQQIQKPRRAGTALLAFLFIHGILFLPVSFKGAGHARSRFFLFKSYHFRQVPASPFVRPGFPRRFP